MKRSDGIRRTVWLIRVISLMIVVVLEFGGRLEGTKPGELRAIVFTINGFHGASKQGMKIVDVFCGEAYPLRLSVSVHGLIKSVNGSIMLLLYP